MFNIGPVNSISSLPRDLEEFLADINPKNVNSPVAPGGVLPLIFAVQRNNLVAVKDLISKGANVSLKDNNGQTALHHACIQADLVVVMALLSPYNFGNFHQNISQLSFTTVPQYPNLEAIPTNQYNEIRQQNIKTGYNLGVSISVLNMQDNKGKTPLHYALMVPFDKGIIRYLIDNGADIYLKDNNEQTPFHLACIKKDLKFLKILLEKEKNNPYLCTFLTNNKDIYKKTSIDLLKQSGHEDIADLLSNNNIAGAISKINGKDNKAVEHNEVKENKDKQSQCCRI